MRIISVNISTGDPMELAGEVVKTGIFKQTVESKVRIRKLGLESDFIADLKHHGGPDQAVYLYSVEDYQWWQTQLGRELPVGLFGENLSIDRFETSADRIKPGDRYRIGDSVELEVTSARVPCAKLGKVMGDSSFVKQFVKAQRPGIYCRVLREGEVEQDDSMEYHPIGGDGPGVLDLFNLYFAKHKDRGLIERLLATPMDERGKGYLRAMLG